MHARQKLAQRLQAGNQKKKQRNGGGGRSGRGVMTNGSRGKYPGFQIRCPDPRGYAMAPPITSIPKILRRHTQQQQRRNPQDHGRQQRARTNATAVIPRPPSPKDRCGSKSSLADRTLSFDRVEQLMVECKQNLRNSVPLGSWETPRWPLGDPGIDVAVCEIAKAIMYEPDQDKDQFRRCYLLSVPVDARGKRCPSQAVPLRNSSAGHLCLRLGTSRKVSWEWDVKQIINDRIWNWLQYQANDETSHNARLGPGRMVIDLFYRCNAGCQQEHVNLINNRTSSSTSYRLTGCPTSGQVHLCRANPRSCHSLAESRDTMLVCLESGRICGKHGVVMAHRSQQYDMVRAMRHREFGLWQTSGRLDGKNPENRRRARAVQALVRGQSSSNAGISQHQHQDDHGQIMSWEPLEGLLSINTFGNGSALDLTFLWCSTTADSSATGNKKDAKLMRAFDRWKNKSDEETVRGSENIHLGAAEAWKRATPAYSPEISFAMDSNAVLDDPMAVDHEEAEEGCGTEAVAVASGGSQVYVNNGTDADSHLRMSEVVWMDGIVDTRSADLGSSKSGGCEYEVREETMTAKQLCDRIQPTPQLLLAGRLGLLPPEMAEGLDRDRDSTTRMQQSGGSREQMLSYGYQVRKHNRKASKKTRAHRNQMQKEMMSMGSSVRKCFRQSAENAAEHHGPSRSETSHESANGPNVRLSYTPGHDRMFQRERGIVERVLHDILWDANARHQSNACYKQQAMERVHKDVIDAVREPWVFSSKEATTHGGGGGGGGITPHPGASDSPTSCSSGVAATNPEGFSVMSLLQNFARRPTNAGVDRDTPAEQKSGSKFRFLSMPQLHAIVESAVADTLVPVVPFDQQRHNQLVWAILYLWRFVVHEPLRIDPQAEQNIASETGSNNSAATSTAGKNQRRAMLRDYQRKRRKGTRLSSPVKLAHFVLGFLYTAANSGVNLGEHVGWPRDWWLRDHLPPERTLHMYGSNAVTGSRVAKSQRECGGRILSLLNDPNQCIAQSVPKRNQKTSNNNASSRNSSTIANGSGRSCEQSSTKDQHSTSTAYCREAYRPKNVTAGKRAITETILYYDGSVPSAEEAARALTDAYHRQGCKEKEEPGMVRPHRETDRQRQDNPDRRWSMTPPIDGAGSSTSCSFPSGLSLSSATLQSRSPKRRRKSSSCLKRNAAYNEKPAKESEMHPDGSLWFCCMFLRRDRRHAHICPMINPFRAERPPPGLSQELIRRQGWSLDTVIGPFPQRQHAKRFCIAWGSENCVSTADRRQYGVMVARQLQILNVWTICAQDGSDRTKRAVPTRSDTDPLLLRAQQARRRTEQRQAVLQGTVGYTAVHGGSNNLSTTTAYRLPQDPVHEQSGLDSDRRSLLQDQPQAYRVLGAQSPTRHQICSNGPTVRIARGTKRPRPLQTAPPLATLNPDRTKRYQPASGFPGLVSFLRTVIEQPQSQPATV